MDTRPTPLRCELCGTDAFDALYLPGTAQPIGLQACRRCRLVYGPPPAPPTGRGAAPEPPDLARYGPTASRR